MIVASNWKHCSGEWKLWCDLLWMILCWNIQFLTSRFTVASQETLSSNVSSAFSCFHVLKAESCQIFELKIVGYISKMQFNTYTKEGSWKLLKCLNSNFEASVNLELSMYGYVLSNHGQVTVRHFTLEGLWLTKTVEVKTSHCNLLLTTWLLYNVCIHSVQWHSVNLYQIILACHHECIHTHTHAHTHIHTGWDFEDLPNFIKEVIEVHYAENYGDVYKIVFPNWPP